MDKKNVSVAKGLAGGYAYSAPLTAAVPTDIETALPDAFSELGYISSDGITESESKTDNDFTDLNGDPIESTSDDRSETWAFTLVEMAEASLAEAYGHGNVTDADGLLKVAHNGEEPAHRIYVFELVLKNGRRWRKVIPDGKVTNKEDLTVSKSQLAARRITVKGFADAAGNTCYDYIESTETTAPAGSGD